MSPTVAEFVPKIHDLVRYGTVAGLEAELADARAGTAKHPQQQRLGPRSVVAPCSWAFCCTPRFRDEDFAEWLLTTCGRDLIRGGEKG